MISFEGYNWKESWMRGLAQGMLGLLPLRKAVKKKFLSLYSEADWPNGSAFCFAVTCWDDCWWHDSGHLGKLQVLGRIVTTFFVPWGEWGSYPSCIFELRTCPLAFPLCQTKFNFFLNPIWWIWFCMCLECKSLFSQLGDESWTSGKLYLTASQHLTFTSLIY